MVRGGDSCFEMWRIIKLGMSELRGKNNPLRPPTQAENDELSTGRHVSCGVGEARRPLMRNSILSGTVGSWGFGAT